MRPCALLALHLHQVVRGTFTPELLSMPGTRRGQPVADPNRMSDTFLPVWLRFFHPNCSGEPPVAPTLLRDENLCIIRANAT